MDKKTLYDACGMNDVTAREPARTGKHRTGFNLQLL